MIRPFVYVGLIIVVLCLVAAIPNSSIERPVTVQICRDSHGPAGTGFFIADDMVMTAGHVVVESYTYNINGYPVIEICRGLEGDCAILTVETPEVEEGAVFASPALGETVVMTGRMREGGFDLWSRGIVSSVPFYNDYFESQVYFSDYASRGGQSGSPVLNDRNEVVGMHLGCWEGYSMSLSLEGLPL